MNQKQFKYFFEVYSKNKAIKLVIENGYIVARNKITNCIHPFVDGREKIKLTPEIKKINDVTRLINTI